MALGIGSMLMLSSAQLYPLLRQRSQNLAHHFQLDQLLRSTVSNIEKDLRRAGFCNGECSGRATVMGQSMGEPSHSCVIIAYDLNRNGRWEPASNDEAEYFAYRLRAGAIETQRGAVSCEGSGWEKLLDPAEVKVTDFKVTKLLTPRGKSLFTINIAAHWRGAATVHRRVETHVAGRAR